jgi:hypothetical protein
MRVAWMLAHVRVRDSAAAARFIHDRQRRAHEPILREKIVNLARSSVVAAPGTVCNDDLHVLLRRPFLGCSRRRTAEQGGRGEPLCSVHVISDNALNSTCTHCDALMSHSR